MLVSDKVEVGYVIQRKARKHKSGERESPTLQGVVLAVYPKFCVAEWECGYRESVRLNLFGRIDESGYSLVGKRAKRE